MKYPSILFIITFCIFCTACKQTSYTTNTKVRNDTISIKNITVHELGIANMTLQQIETRWGTGTCSSKFKLTKEDCLGDENPEINCEVLADTVNEIQEYLWYVNEYIVRQVFFLNQNGRLTAIDGRETCIDCIHLP